MSVILLLSGFVRNTATLGVDLEKAYRASRSTEQAVLSAYGRFLARLADAARFPELRKVIDAGVFDEPDEPDTEFVFGLERVLDGVEALVRARG